MKILSVAVSFLALLRKVVSLENLLIIVKHILRNETFEKELGGFCVNGELIFPLA